VPGSHDVEVPAIQSCQLNDPETFCQSDKTRVGSAERHVRVLLYQFGAAAQIGRSEIGAAKKPVVNERRNSASTVEPASRARR
jgi:hypothetical protein